MLRVLRVLRVLRGGEPQLIAPGSSCRGPDTIQQLGRLAGLAGLGKEARLLDMEVTVDSNSNIIRHLRRPLMLCRPLCLLCR